MKVVKPVKKKSKLYSSDEEKERSIVKRDSGLEVASWAVTNPTEFSELAAASATENVRLPEFWVGPNDRRHVFFMDKDAVVAFRAYNLKIGGRYQLVVAPPDGEPDLIAEAFPNLRPSSRFLFRVVDIDGYTPKSGPNKGKRVRNVPKFYIVGSRQYEAIKLQAVEVPRTPLNACAVLIVRAGAGQSSVTSYFKKPEMKKTPEIIRAIENCPDWKKLLHPPSEAEQRRLIRNRSAEEDDQD